MESEKDIIVELKSERARQVLGQIPPKITRLGISLLLFIFVALIITSYYFKFDHTIKTTALIDPSSVPPSVLIKIPASEIGEVFLGQEVFLFFKSIPFIHNESLLVEINQIPKDLVIEKDGGHFFAKAVILHSTQLSSGAGFAISEKIEVEATVIGRKKRLLDKFLNTKKLFRGESN